MEVEDNPKNEDYPENADDLKNKDNFKNDSWVELCAALPHNNSSLFAPTGLSASPDRNVWRLPVKMMWIKW